MTKAEEAKKAVQIKGNSERLSGAPGRLSQQVQGDVM